MSTRRAAEIAWQMADLAQELNDAQLTEISDVYDVAGALKTMAQRLPQACQQTSLWLGQQQAAGHVVHARGDDPQPFVTDVRAGFEEAQSAADALERAMTVAHNSSTWLKGAQS